MDGLKGDLDAPNFRMESKATEASSMSIKHSWLRKISQEAINVDKFPALVVTFTKPNTDPLDHGQWVAVPIHVFNEMMEKYNDKKD